MNKKTSQALSVNNIEAQIVPLYLINELCTRTLCFPSRT